MQKIIISPSPESPEKKGRGEKEKIWGRKERLWHTRDPGVEFCFLPKSWRGNGDGVNTSFAI